MKQTEFFIFRGTWKKEKNYKAIRYNVSLIKKSERVPYFDMCIQTESELLRGVCFSPVKHEELKKKNR